jgi:hypothetical protein
MKRYERTNERTSQERRERERSNEIVENLVYVCVCARVVCIVRLYEYNHHHIFFFSCDRSKTLCVTSVCVTGGCTDK